MYACNIIPREIECFVKRAAVDTTIEVYLTQHNGLCTSTVDNVPKIPNGDYHLNTKRAAEAAVIVDAAAGVYRKADDGECF
jgi:hypothetical protein